ncbi:MAG: right-handed parallel beta-helix repeat-containing protein [Pirellulales bacterium]|nr:right-handed parallel beta-helix repeat-containing protein [Pirellulales bacterium]
MRSHRDSGIWLVSVLLAFGMAAVEAADAPQGPGGPFPSGSPTLDAAAAALAEGQLDDAQSGFEAVAKDTSLPPFVRGLAWFGVAETAWTQNDIVGATSAWQQLAADASLPRAHRDTARRRIAETQRIRKGLPGRDPAAYRVQLPTLPEPAVTFHVAPDGSDTADGSGVNPFRTLEKARDAVRALKQSHEGKLPKGGVWVVVHGGAYPVQQTLSLTAEDSGTAETPVVYQAQPGKAPVFGGGVRIKTWKPISDVGLREKLDPSVRGQVFEADLRALGVKDLGDATALRRSPELFCGGVPQTLARWPNEGFIKTGEVLGKETFKVWNSISGCRDGKFRYLEDCPGRWTDESDVRLYGYWFWDWYEEYQKVASIDPAGRTFTLAPPYSQYGYRQDQRYFAVNLFCELDRPGEWYLDRRSGMVYWIPPEDFDPAETPTTLSVLAEPFVAMENVEHVIFLGLTFQEGRGNGIQIRGGAECLVAGCTLRQLGGDAIVVEGGRQHGIFGCTMHTLGCGGTRVAGGDRKTLTPGGHFVENCTVSNISRLKRTYTPAVLLNGCGNRVAHNAFEHIPSSALRIEGNDQLVELNVIRNVVQESDDQGGLDMFGNPLYRGVVIRWNRWSDIRGGTHCGAAGVRLDDMISGVAVYGNVFERCGAVQFGGVQIHGGKENLVDGNLFFDCYAGISFSRWGEKRWLEAIHRFLPEASEPPYSTRYPSLTRIKADADVNCISRNVFVRCHDVFLRDGGVERTALNSTIDWPVIPVFLSNQEAVRSDSQLRRLLFEAIPIREIGTYPHPWAGNPESPVSSK